MTEEISLPTCIDRKELWKSLWDRPAVRVAGELGISNNALAALCRAHKIPRPRAGHWTKVEHGTQPDPTPLPRLKSEEVYLKDVFLQRSEDDKRRLTTQSIYDVDKIYLDRTGNIEVDWSLKDAHPIVADWITEHLAETKKRAQINMYGRQVRSRKPLRARMTQADKRRLAVINTFLQMAEAHEFDVVEANVNGVIHLQKFSAEVYKVYIMQQMRRRKKGEKRDQSWSCWPEHHARDLNPTPSLRFGVQWNSYEVVNFKETAAQPLPESLGKAFARLQSLALHDDFSSAQKTPETLNAKERIWSAFRHAALDHEECQRLRGFLAELESNPSFGRGTIYGMKTADAVAMIEDRIDKLDPLKADLKYVFRDSRQR
jgi:hypothetical protein